MIVADDFQINDTNVVFKRDEYPISKIRGARVKTNSLKDHALRIVIIGLVVSSVVWMIFPGSLGFLTAPLALILGMLLALATVRKYELQIEFQHIDETGLQWVSIAKTNKLSVKELFEKQASEILRNIT
ncbi:hypothetical protein C9J03_00700 [Photobacterium gaetbulicola]|uniref:Uncharacterized protein n=2 Tax=Photobacterium gaetbulicola TaxID=1295392 RepID=A0A0C5WRR5_9GAMM|nr:DUF6232 family protein [Photobacterium gaetbulicola]AJR05660.1 hypothetical protein H744_1c0635 [Photobacterium gaetbulicola Gung47]KHT58506.1 hypothetical protein RJ45_25240 [Photobacterium gaetbulicola]PSU14638.1 hypothetical protein C9J03_00700 [Photobacterium gaetbulicola]